MQTWQVIGHVFRIVANRHILDHDAATNWPQTAEIGPLMAGIGFKKAHDAATASGEAATLQVYAFHVYLSVPLFRLGAHSGKGIGYI